MPNKKFVPISSIAWTGEISTEFENRQCNSELRSVIFKLAANVGVCMSEQTADLLIQLVNKNGICLANICIYLNAFSHIQVSSGVSELHPETVKSAFANGYPDSKQLSAYWSMNRRTLNKYSQSIWPTIGELV